MSDQEDDLDEDGFVLLWILRFLFIFSSLLLIRIGAYELGFTRAKIFVLVASEFENHNPG